MAIIAPQTAPNYSIGNYHRILKAELNCSPTEATPRWTIYVGFYASADARAAYADPMFVNIVTIPLAALPEDPRVGLYNMLMETDLFCNTNAAPDVVLEADNAVSPSPQLQA